MSQTEANVAPVPIEEIQKSWHEFALRMQQTEAECKLLEQENKSLRALLEKVVEHRKKSHGELVNLVTTLVTKLPINDVGVIVSRLVEHSAAVNEVSAALIHGKNEENLLQPAILRLLDKTKRDLTSTVKPLIDELIQLDAPLDRTLLLGVIEKPESFYTPASVRASRAFVKGQVPREQIVKEFGDEALVFFKDLTTDAKHNPRPKPEEIMLAFKSDFDALLQQNPNVVAAKRAELIALQKRVRASRESRAQKIAFLKLSFVLELLRYYENQSTESPDVVFAQRLPPLVEQLVVTGENDALDEKYIKQAEELLAFIINADYRQAVVNNFGKAGGASRTLRFVLTFRAAIFTEHDPVTMDFVRHLLGAQKTPAPQPIVAALKFLNPEAQKVAVRAILNTDRLGRAEAETLAKTLIQELGLPALPAPSAGGGLSGKAQISPWDMVKELIVHRAAPGEITEAIRRQLHAKYDADEIKQSWLVLAESDAMSLVRVFCLLPYLPDGQTDPIARVVLESYANRLTHEKYAATYAKVVQALRNMFKVKADSPALANFITLVKWVAPESADKLAKDIGMTA
ncbi:MAG TPA: hypothetical protein VMB22_06470 [Verrucomicrobiae bacterium]|nr:hypothetical protein [Verrucomicrobiae bacterium]